MLPSFRLMEYLRRSNRVRFDGGRPAGDLALISMQPGYVVEQSVLTAHDAGRRMPSPPDY